MYSISFCTTCMNRLPHLKKTLIKNMIDNQSYPKVEFIILDYNSSDGLAQFIAHHFSDFCLTGRLKFYRTDYPKKFNWSHSRNLAFKLATGDIVCNIDADNYTGTDFAAYVNNAFKTQTSTFLSTIGSTHVPKDALGRICMMKEDFMKVGGYDERFEYYGFEDYDIDNRLQLLGLRKQVINSPNFHQIIPHSDNDRMKNRLSTGLIKHLLIKYLTPATSELIFLLEDGVLYHGTMVNNHVFNILNDKAETKRLSKYSYSLMEDNWEPGEWSVRGQSISLSIYPQEIFNQKSAKSLTWFSAISGNIDLLDCKSERLIREGLFFFHQISGRKIMEKNFSEKKVRVNRDGFGRGKVYANFNYDSPIYLT